MQTIDVMGYQVFADDLATIRIDKDQKCVINTINAHAYIVAKSDPLFKTALIDADILLPDGSGIVLAAKKTSGIEIKKIAGADIHQHLLEYLNKQHGKVFYMGAAQKTLDLIHERIEKDYPNIMIESYSPPYKDQFSNEENIEIIERINAFSPDVLFIGMTAPKQEKWLHEHKELLDFKVASSIGAVFDFFAGTVQRPSEFWINMHLEWLPRFLAEPKRLWRRNLVSTPLFLKEMIFYKNSSEI